MWLILGRGGNFERHVRVGGQRAAVLRAERRFWDELNDRVSYLLAQEEREGAAQKQERSPRRNTSCLARSPKSVLVVTLYDTLDSALRILRALVRSWYAPGWSLC